LRPIPYGPQDRQLDYSCFSDQCIPRHPSGAAVTAIDNGKLLKPGIIRTCHPPTAAGAAGYGLGWTVETVDVMGTPTRRRPRRRGRGTGGVADDEPHHMTVA
jgi:hypothetical protein